MAKRHGDFGDLSRYDVAYSTDLGGPRIEVGCQDCGCVIASWPGTEVNLPLLTRAASQHETEEDQGDDHG